MRVSRTMIAVLCALVLALAVPAGAQTTASGTKNDSTMGLSLDEGLLGKSIKTRNGEEVGEVSDVIFSRDGKISQVLVDVGGFLGIGEKTVALNLDQLQFDDKDHALFRGSQSDLEKMEEVDVYAYRRPYRGYYDPAYGPYSPYGSSRGYDPYDRRGYMRDRSERDYWGYRDRDSGDFARDREARREAPRREYYEESREGRDRMRHGRGMEQGRMREGMGRHMGMEMSGHLFLGAPVYDHRNDHLGEVSDFVVDPANGRITHAVIDVGGVLGIGDKRVVVPFRHLTEINPDYVMYRGTEEQLKRMPAFEKPEDGRVSGAFFEREQRAGGQGERKAEPRQDKDTYRK